MVQPRVVQLNKPDSKDSLDEVTLCVYVCVPSRKKRGLSMAKTLVYSIRRSHYHINHKYPLAHLQSLWENKALNSVGIWDTNTPDKDLL